MEQVRQPAKAKAFLDRAREAGLRVEVSEAGVWFISRTGSLAGGHYLYLFVLEGSKGGNLRAYLGGRKNRRDQRVSKSELASWISVLAG